MIIQLAFAIALSCCIPHSLYSAGPGGNGGPMGFNPHAGPGFDMSGFDFSAPMPIPTEEQMEEIYKYLNSLSPDELKELEKIGEELIKEYDKKGIPIFDAGPVASKEPITPAPSPKKIDTRDKEIEKPKPTIIIKDEKITESIELLLEALASIKQKTVSDDALFILLNNNTPKLSVFIFYLHAIKTKAHLERLQTKDFTDIRDGIEWLSKECQMIDHELDIPEFDITASRLEAKARKKILVMAKQTVEYFIATIEKAFKGRLIIEKLEEFFKKYEPEVIKLKDELEKQERYASGQSLRQATTNNSPSGIVSYKPHHTGQHHQHGANNASYFGGNNYNPTSYGQSQNAGQSNVNNPGNGIGGQKPGSTPSSSGPKKDGTGKDTKDNSSNNLSLTDEQKRSQSLSEGFEKIKVDLQKLAEVIGTHKNKYLDFIYSYETDTTRIDDIYSSMIIEALGNATIATERTVKKIKEWNKNLKNAFDNARDITQHKNHLKKLGEQMLTDLTEIAPDMKTIRFATDPTKENMYQDIVDEFNKMVKELYKELGIKLTSSSSRTTTPPTGPTHPGGSGGGPSGPPPPPPHGSTGSAPTGGGRPRAAATGTGGTATTTATAGSGRPIVPTRPHTSRPSRPPRPAFAPNTFSPENPSSSSSSSSSESSTPYEHQQFFPEAMDSSMHNPEIMESDN